MSKSGKKIIEGAKEALSVVRGEVTAASIYVAGHRYVPVEELDALRSALSAARAEARREALEAAVAIVDELDPNADDVAAAIRALSQ